ncbi:hypothetical protein L2520_08545 [Limosilactobacillus vaginalis]|uniref:Uncharacterized protein n=1 Tax=Limosilactobacillus vaginalis TaxID=1633 RepID=A0ABT4K926_9LACO|nr:hypothetical protein [Limosilactobacillus vaginalis]MCZ3747431.1 hypothetical protein [Limosilactobacillus vaginalis]MCZ3752414.1 hypothetical protein [Limosilactobacillus vaginalis]MCZ3754139.1 hypothetical protein [Limosilactobacillus vaginalis]MCZ3755852.1 hypothetical protein [Limosilactobacillus vaginalis]MCZ3757585.1 hypothetical protein [Limosilactobacillus vaginalis]
MSLMQNTSEISKTDQQVYSITLVRKSPDLPMYIDNMIYESAQSGQKFMTKLVAAFSRAGYRDSKVDDDHYKLTNGLDKISLSGKLEDVFKD